AARLEVAAPLGALSEHLPAAEALKAGKAIVALWKLPLPTQTLSALANHLRPVCNKLEGPDRSELAREAANRLLASRSAKPSADETEAVMRGLLQVVGCLAPADARRLVESLTGALKKYEGNDDPRLTGQALEEAAARLDGPEARKV